MKWEDCAIQDLKKLNMLKSSIINIQERIEVLEMKFEGIKAISISDDITGLNDKPWDDHIVDNIVERKRLKLLLEADKKMIKIINRGMSCLDTNEQKVLEGFYIDKQRDHIEYLKEELMIEKSQVYRIKNQALYKFTSHMYGLAEL